MATFGPDYNQKLIIMKRLFFSVFALTLGAFTFISCDDDDKINNDDKDGGKFMTVQEQQTAISNALNGLADAVEFTEFSNVLEVVSGISEREIGIRELIGILSSPEVLEDTIFQNKLTQALIIFTSDSLVLDLSPLYMAADLYVTDSVRIDTTRTIGEGGSAGFSVDTTYLTILTLKNLKYDVDCVQLNVYVDDHVIGLKAKVKAGESFVKFKTAKETKTIVLPESAEISIDLDGKNLFKVGGEYKSDCSMVLEQDADGKIQVDFDGTKFSVKGNIEVLGYQFDGSCNFDIKSGVDGKITAKYSGTELLSIDGKINASFESVDLTDSVKVLAWLQNPEELKSVSLNASLGGGKVEFKSNLDNPFKDDELAKILRGLMISDDPITAEQEAKLDERINEVFTAGFYFEDYKEAQAKVKFVYNKREDKSTVKSGNSLPDDEDSDELLTIISELFDGVGTDIVLVVHDDEGNEVEMPFMEYFGGIDVEKFINTLEEKFMSAFGPIIAAINAEEGDVVGIK